MLKRSMAALVVALSFSTSCFADVSVIVNKANTAEINVEDIKRIFLGPQHVLATGGGAFMNKEIRHLIKEKGISIWLRASLEVLVERTSRRSGRPLLDNGDAKTTLKYLIDERYPTYASADIIVDTKYQPHQEMVTQIIKSYSALEK